MSNNPPQIDRALFRTQFQLDFANELNVDIFAGGGGASTGFEMASDRPVDIAINHDEDAISMHTANHPAARHYISDVYEVDPVEATGGQPVGHLHFSPDCTHHSQALGGQPRERSIRSLAWVGIRWAGMVKPRCITMENVQQMQDWSPLVAKRDKATGRVVKLDRTIAKKGERVPVNEQYLVPDKRRKGHNWRHFIRSLERLGYEVKWWVLNAADYGAATRRRRLFLVARRDGVAITKPKPTHGAIRAKGLLPHRSAAECIDWQLPGKSIFHRKRPLAEATLIRIAKGINKHVINANDPFLSPTGEDLVAPILVQANGGFNTTAAHSVKAPMSTITTKGSQQQLVSAKLCPVVVGDNASCASSITVQGLLLRPGGQPSRVHTLSAELPAGVEDGARYVASFLMEYYGTGGQWASLHQPTPTVTTRDRIALVCVVIDGATYAIVDITLRMLTPRELYRAQGFPENYQIDKGHDGRTFTKSQKVRMVGNSVSPLPMAAVVRSMRDAERVSERTQSAA